MGGYSIYHAGVTGLMKVVPSAGFAEFVVLGFFCLFS